MNEHDYKSLWFAVCFAMCLICLTIGIEIGQQMQPPTQNINISVDPELSKVLN